MYAPKVPRSMKVGGRINNSNNPLRVRMWHSGQPAAAWFVTVFNPVTTAMTAERLQPLFPDASYILVAYCMQEVLHVHIVLMLCNVYARETVARRIEDAFGGRARRCKVELCPIYDSMPNAIGYIAKQVYGNSITQVIVGDPTQAGSYGNAWAREYTGNPGAGVTVSKLRTWCLQGFPAYAVNATPHSQAQAMHAAVAFNNMHVNKPDGAARRHYNKQVKVVHAQNGDGTEPISDCYDYLLQFFGSQRAATPFVYDIRGLLCPYVKDPFPGYTGQPGLVLFVDDDYEAKTTQRETVLGLQARKGAYGNLEAMWVVRL